MDKFRRALVLIFGSLSILFAAIAIIKNCRKFPREQVLSTECSEWGKSIESAARSENKLIFFTVGNANAKFCDSTKKCLKQYYIVSNLCPDKFPADYLIFRGILSRAAGSAKNVEAGILSPKLYPLFITSKAEAKGTSATLESILIAAASMHFKYGISECTDSHGRFQTNEFKFVKTPIGEEIAKVPHFVEAHSWAISVLLNRNRQLPPAILSENTRLASKIAVKYPRHPFAMRTAETGVVRLLQFLAEKRDFGRSQLLCLRALGEICVENGTPKLKAECLKFADFILLKQNRHGIFCFSADNPTLADNALAVSFLTSVSKLSGNPKYKEAAAKCAEILNSFLMERGELRAVLSRTSNSQASSYEYALLAKSFADMYKLCVEDKYINAAIRTIEEWNRFYMTDSGLWSVNSENSILSDFARPVFVEDNDMPSYLGEAAQTFAYLNKTAGKKLFENSTLLERISDNAFRTLPVKSMRLASLKLALLE